jgi:hypothetical protein
MLMKSLSVAILTVANLVAANVASAATTAYWRHEEGASGGLIAAGPDTVLDSSGTGDHMRTFDPAFTSATYTSNVSPLPLRSGLLNTLSLDFGPGGDDAGKNDDNYADAKSINAEVFTAMTVELAFNMDSVGPGQYQALVGKDGKPTGGPAPPFKVLVRGDDFPDAIPHQLFIEWFDGDGDLHFLTSRQSLNVGQWNHVAFTLTATDAQMWVASATGPYTLLDSKAGDFAGPGGEVLINTTGNYTIGRGMFNGGITDWSDALIDEVRISDTALPTNQFLFVAVPEPATAAMLAVALGAVGLCRRRIGG